VRILNGCEAMESNFEVAKDRISGLYHNVPEFGNRIASVGVDRSSQITTSFSEKEVGLDRKNRKTQK
jgi:hypothetical protein